MPGRRTGPLSRLSKYQPLADFLATQEADTHTLPLVQIEITLGFPLPVVAYWIAPGGAVRTVRGYGHGRRSAGR